jgi:hypothetical protein
VYRQNTEMKMKTTGYGLREAIKQHELRRDTASRAFAGTLKSFADEKKEKPQEVVIRFLAAEKAIARLQTAQMRYNLLIEVEVQTEKMSLAEAIKRIGADARVEKMWRSAIGPAPDRYGSFHNEDVRDPNQVRATATITPTDATKLASQAAKRAGAFRAAIATGNAREVEIEGLDPALFE